MGRDVAVVVGDAVAPAVEAAHGAREPGVLAGPEDGDAPALGLGARRRGGRGARRLVALEALRALGLGARRRRPGPPVPRGRVPDVPELPVGVKIAGAVAAELARPPVVREGRVLLVVEDPEVLGLIAHADLCRELLVLGPDAAVDAPSGADPRRDAVLAEVEKSRLPELAGFRVVG